MDDILDQNAAYRDLLFWRVELLLYSIAHLSRSSPSKPVLQIMEAQCLDIIETKIGNNSMTMAVLSSHARILGDEANAITYLEKAITLASDDARPRYQRDLAKSFYYQKRYAECAGILQGLLEHVLADPEQDMYVLSLKYSKQNGKALEQAKRVREARGGDAIPYISEVEAELLDEYGDIEGSLHLYRELAKQDSHPHRYVMMAAFAALKLERKDLAKELCQDISYEQIKDNVPLLFNAALIRQKLNMEGALRFAYRAYRIGSSDQSVSFNYVKFCLNPNNQGIDSQEAQIGRSFVSVGDAVTLQRVLSNEIVSSDNLTYVIEEDNPVNAHLNEISVSDPRAQKLLNHRVGDEVELTPGTLLTTKWRVTEIKSKFVYACHAIMEKMKTGILHDSSSSAMSVLDIDSFLDKTLPMLQRQELHGRKVLDMYNENNTLMSLSLLSRCLHRHPYEIWHSLIQIVGSRFYSFRGEDTFQKQATQNMEEEGKSILVLHSTALLTIAYLFAKGVDITYSLRKQFSRILLSHATWEEFQGFEADVTSVGYTGHVMTSSHGLPTIVEAAESELQEKLRIAKFIRSFCRNEMPNNESGLCNVEVVPVLSLADADDKMLEAIGKSEMAAIHLAKELGAVLYVDDARTRLLAENATRYNVKCIDTQTIVNQEYKSKSIDGIVCNKVFTLLALANYHFISLDVKKIVNCLQQDGYQMTSAVRAMLNTLSGAYGGDKASSVYIVAEVIKHLWTKSLLLVEQKRILLHLLLSVVAQDRDVVEVTFDLQNILRSTLSLTPLHWYRVKEEILLWVGVVTDQKDSKIIRIV